MAHKTGAIVRQIVSKPQEGEIVARRFSDTNEQMEYHVRSADGSVDRWFLESDIEHVSDPAPEGEAQVIDASSVGDVSDVIKGA